VGVALHGIERVNLKPGDSVAIIGPGPIGIAAAMLASQAGAQPVMMLGLGVDEQRLEFVRQMGHRVIVTDREDPVSAVREMTEGRGVDLAIDVSGGRGTLALAVELVRPGGQIAAVGLSPEAPLNPTTVALKELTIYGSFRRQPSTWYRAIKLVASRKIDVRPLVTHQFAVADAQEAFETLLDRKGIKAIITPD